MTKLQLTKPKPATPATSFEAWIRQGHALRDRLLQLERQTDPLMWELGDWLNAGQHEWGQKYKAAEAMFAHKYQVLVNAASVAKRVEVSRRRYKASFWHHYEVASLGAKDQVHFLELAIQNKWSAPELRKRIRLAISDAPRPAGMTVDFVPTDWAMEFVRWWGRQDVESMPQSRKIALKRELEPVVEIYQKL